MKYIDMVLGITGGVATGKTTVAKMFERLGAFVLSADDIANELIEPKKLCWKKIIKHFGRDILKSDNTIDKGKLGEMIFSNRNKRKILNSITHPEIIKEIKRKLKTLRNPAPSRCGIIILEAPLLIEANALDLVSKIIVVTADRKTQIKRLNNKGITRDKAEKIIDSQMQIRKKIKYADYVINNNSTLKNTEKQVKEILNDIKFYATII